MSSVPPDTVRVELPKTVMWGWVGSLIGLAFALWLSWLNMHDEILRLKIDVATYKAEADAAKTLAGSVESRVDVTERKIQHLEDTRR